MYKGDLFVLLPMSIVEQSKKVALLELIRFYSFDSVLVLSDVKQTTDVDWPHYLDKEFPFPNYDFNNSVFEGVISDLRL